MSYGGLEAPIIFGDFGLVGTAAMATLPPNALVQAENVAYQAAELIPALGSKRINSTPLSGGAHTVIALYEWSPLAGQRRVVAITSLGDIYQDNGLGEFVTLLRQGFVPQVDPVMAEGGGEEVGKNRKLFITLGEYYVLIVDGTAAVTRFIGPNAPAEWIPIGGNAPRTLVAHASRMWGFAHERAYASSVLDHENFNDTTNGALTKVVGPGVGERIEGAISFKERLFIFKWPRGIFIYDTTPIATTNWILTELTRGIGLAGPRALAVGGNEVLFVSEIGHLHFLSNVLQNDITASDLTSANLLDDWWKENITQDPLILKKSTVVYYQARQEFHVSIAGLGRDVCNLRIVVDMKKKDTPRLYVVTKDMNQSLATRTTPERTQQLIAGDGGFVWAIDEEERSVAGAPYTCIFRTPSDDFAWVDPHLRTRRKNLAFLELLGIATGNFTLSVDTYLDGEFGETINFNLSPPGSTSALGTFVLGTDRLGAGAGPLASRRKLRGSCHRLSLKARFTSQASTFRISGFVVSFTMGGHRP